MTKKQEGALNSSPLLLLLLHGQFTVAFTIGRPLSILGPLSCPVLLDWHRHRHLRVLGVGVAARAHTFIFTFTRPRRPLLSFVRPSSSTSSHLPHVYDAIDRSLTSLPASAPNFDAYHPYLSYHPYHIMSCHLHQPSPLLSGLG